MKLAIFLIILLVLFAIFTFTRHFWDRPKEGVDMVKKFDTIVKKGISLGDGGRILELRDNFIKVGVRNQNGEKALMVKQRPNNEYRVLYTRSYDPVYKDLKFNHVFPDSANQEEIVSQFEKEIESRSEKRK